MSTSPLPDSRPFHRRFLGMAAGVPPATVTADLAIGALRGDPNSTTTEHADATFSAGSRTPPSVSVGY
ncbi:hypothetical protein Sipo8835_10130 [Streptomyces ipomoeae]|jgi:hypothetical protein|uniref:Uncharacterized protein n=1 Tax=Streptomyces ipomoeae TaxID=103232 RepID=A0AAE8W4B9_9ACTN|nr:hypothetical protein [Streptomyces ipomoeae]MDX2692795.1 hypothetical protein [Streptomyces ipomoeae]MDX2819618.1 hypothetical protein [Streptomyces ipomoeae]MDX2838343.1 hypothetical protein [Streptomyces ipomoeae]MDX2872663.1 hypothetical protein [Streptomyces ipomoeae]TQE36252.1 hypothetical protein Sipo7851_12745 [Streptomyces ipomoeae]